MAIKPNDPLTAQEREFIRKHAEYIQMDLARGIGYDCPDDIALQLATLYVAVQAVKCVTEDIALIIKV